jgi:hypothetical protein
MATPPKTTMVSKIGVQTSTNRNVAATPIPGYNPQTVETTTEIFTYLTKAATDGQSQVLYNGDRQYAEITLTLETAGPVCIGNKQNLLPVLSGKGELLETGVPRSICIAKGNRLWVAATGINRIKVEVKPFAWLEQIAGISAAGTAANQAIFAAITAAMNRMSR